jgi:hypothetical protein
LADRTASEKGSILFLERHSLDGFEKVLGCPADVSVRHLIDPANNAVLVHQNGGRERYVFAPVAIDVTYVELIEELTFLIRKKDELGAQTLAQSAGYGRGIHADGEDLDFFRGDAMIKPLELPELRRTERSPIAAIKQIESRALADQVVGGDHLSLGVRERESWKTIPHFDLELASGEKAAEMDVPEQ